MNFFTQLVHHPWTETLGWTLLHFLWQGVLIAAALAVALWCLRRASANARYLAGLSALLLAGLFPVATAAWIGFQSASPQPGDELVRGDSEASPPVAVEILPATSGEAAPTAVADSHAQHNHTAGRNPTPNAGAASPVLENSAVDDADHSEKHSASDSGEVSITARLRPLLPWAVAVWLFGVAVFSLRLTIIWVRVQRLRWAGTQPMPGVLADRLGPLCERLSVRQPVQLLGSFRVETPTVIGWLKPVILFPASALSRLSPSQLEALLAHELAHIRRWDYPVNLVQTVIETVWFYHPAVWWISRRVRAERENCCDDLAVQVSGDEIGYVRALLEMAELHLAGNRMAVAAGDGDLLGRARRLLAGSSQNRFAPGSGGVLLSALVGLVAVGLFQVAWAEPDQEADPASEREQSAGELDAKNLTPEKIAREVETAFERFSKVNCSAAFEETRNANAYVKREPLPVTGTGKWEYRSDGHRWRATKDGFTFSMGEAEARPARSTAGFDGEEFYQLEDGQFVIGEEPRSYVQIKPRSVFWNGALDVDWLISALKRWNARIEREVTIDGRKGIFVTSEKPIADDGETRWRYEITLSPSQSWLPLKTKIQMNGELYAEETIEELAQTAKGVWYPKRITFKQHRQPDTYMSRSITVTALELPEKFPPGEFQYSLPVGTDIVDYTTGRTWHNDPWWDEMQPWFQARLNWPRPSLRALGDLKSHVNEGIEGQPAPEIAAEKWLGGKPKGWENPERKISVVAFIGGRAISPTPEWIAALRVLHNRYKEDGLEVLGVTNAIVKPEGVEQCFKMLQPGFPWAIDTESEIKGRFGKTFDAFKLKHYAGVFLVNAEGKVQTLESIQKPADSPLSPIEFAIRQALGKNTKNYQPVSERLSDSEYQAIDAEWKLRRNARKGQGEIRVQVQINADGRDVFGEVPVKKTLSDVNVHVRALPEMRMLSSNNPGGWHAFLDRGRTIEEEFLAKDRLVLKNLRKGSYRLTIRPEGLAAVETPVLVLSDDDSAELKLDFHQGDTITGQVVGKDGKVIAGARVKCPVRFFDPENSKRYTTANVPEDAVTDAEGKFVLKGLFTGAYRLEVSAEGFQTQTVSRVPAGKQGLKIILRKPGGAEGVTEANPPAVFVREVLNEATGETIPNVKIAWPINHQGTRRPIWQKEFTSDAKG